MCGRYTLHQKPNELAKRFKVDKAPDIPPNFNVAPGQIMPVITEDESGRHLELMKWGLIPVWSKDPKIGYKLINAREESIFEKPMWRSVIKRKRAIIPADGFYEWLKVQDKKDPKKIIKHPYYIKPKVTETFGFAGIWEEWKDVEGHPWRTYSIITTEANKEMSKVHDRMPVILHPEDEAAWLNPEINDDKSAIAKFLRPLEDNGLEMAEVSTEVNTTKNNDQKLIYPINSA